MATLLVTTGATVTFRELVSHVLSRPFLALLSQNGISKLVVQYGNEVDAAGVHVSSRYFDQQIEWIRAPGSGYKQAPAAHDEAVFESAHLTIVGFPFTTDIVAQIQHADIVVSHAGTGSILDVLRCGNRLVVVTNESLLDNHQLEVAAAMAKDGYLKHCTVEEMRRGELANAIGSLLRGEIALQALPEPATGAVETVLAEELGRTGGSLTAQCD